METKEPKVNIKNTLETLKMYSSTASKVYNLFKQSKLTSAHSTADDWKKFESEMVKMFYSALGEDNPPEAVCNLTAFLNSFALTVATVASLEEQLKKAKPEFVTTNG